MALDRTTPVYDPNVYGEPDYNETSHDVDVYGDLFEGGTEFSFTLDAIILDTQSASFTLDASITAGSVSASFTLDAVIERVVSASFTLDAYKLRVEERTRTLDAIIKKTQAASFTLDARLLRIYTATLNAVVKDTQVASFRLNATLRYPAVPPEQRKHAFIRINNVDYSDDVIYSTAEFTAQVNGQPGSARIQVRDLTHVHSFVTGDELQLYIGDDIVWGGWITKVAPGYAFKVDDTTDAQTTERIWTLEGVDYNILFSKRFLINKATPTNAITNYPTGTHDDDMILDLIENYFYLEADGLDTGGVTHVGTPNPDRSYNAGNPGTSWGLVMALITRVIGSIFYIDPNRVLYHVDEDTPTAPFELSDQPNGTTSFGYRDMEILRNGSNLVNDALVWGAGTGSVNGLVTFSRAEDATSIADHKRWQKGEFTTSLFTQASVDERADSHVFGSPQNLRGGKDDIISVTITVYEPGLVAGDKIELTSEVFGFTDVLPIRRMTVRFPTPFDPEFTLTLSHEVDAPWANYEFWFPPLNFPVPGIDIPGIDIDPIEIPPIVLPGPDGCSDAVCGVSDDFSNAFSDSLTVPAGEDETAVGDLVSSSGWPSEYDIINSNTNPGGSDQTISIAKEDGLLKLVVESVQVDGLAEPDYYLIFDDAELEPPFITRVDFQIVSADLSADDEFFYEIFTGGTNNAQAYFTYSTGSTSLSSPEVPHVSLFYDDNAGALLEDRLNGALTEGVWYHLQIEATPGLEAKAYLWEEGDPEPSTPTLLIGTLGRGNWKYTDVAIFTFANGGVTTPAGPYEMWVRDLDIEGVDRCSSDLFDLFNRTVAAGGWGTSTWGTAWEVLGGGSQFSVTNDQGRIAWTSGSPSIKVDDPNDPWRQAGWTMEQSIQVGTVPSGSAGAVFQLRTLASTNRDLNFTISQNNGSLDLDGDVSTGFTWVSNANYRMKWFYDYTTGDSMAKIWNTVDDEPDWMIVNPFNQNDGQPTEFQYNAVVKTVGSYTHRVNFINFDYTGKPCYQGGPLPEEGAQNEGFLCEVAERQSQSLYTVSATILPGTSRVYINGLFQSRGGLLDYVEDPPNGEIVFNGPEFPEESDIVYVCYTANGPL